MFTREVVFTSGFCIKGKPRDEVYNRYHTLGRRKAVCVHEAGHCLARWYCGHATAYAEVRTLEQLLDASEIEGQVHGYRIPTNYPYEQIARFYPPDLREKVLREAKISIEMAMVEALAGSAAEARYRRRAPLGCLRTTGAADMESVGKLIAWWPPGKEGLTAYHDARNRTDMLVRSDKGWAAITAIADALMARGRVDGEEIETLCRIAYGGQRPTLGTWHKHWPPTESMFWFEGIPKP